MKAIWVFTSGIDYVELQYDSDPTINLNNCYMYMAAHAPLNSDFGHALYHVPLLHSWSNDKVVVLLLVIYCLLLLPLFVGVL